MRFPAISLAAAGFRLDDRGASPLQQREGDPPPVSMRRYNVPVKRVARFERQWQRRYSCKRSVKRLYSIFGWQQRGHLLARVAFLKRMGS